MNFTTPLKGAAEDLFEYSGTIPIIDTHEHIPVKEEYYVNSEIKFGNLFNPYLSNDLKSAGMDFPRDQWSALVCISDDWDDFSKHWEQVKYGSYARPIRIALQKYYGVQDFTRENYLEIVKKINENNKPGIYNRILREDCKIETSIPCSGALPDKNDPLLKGNITSPTFSITSPDAVKQMGQEAGCGEIMSLEDYEAAAGTWMKLQKENGAIEFKSQALPMLGPDKDEARKLFSRVLKGETLGGMEGFKLNAWAREVSAKNCAELDLPLALHTGVWGDFKENTVMDVIELALRNPDTRFDIYHTGIPFVREATLIAKNFPNCTYNMTWSHIVATDMAISALNEAFDMVPMNKIFAFGADYSLFIEKVYGHLWIARENAAMVLGGRVDRGHIGMDEAKALVKAWFYENPKEYYRI